jgi:hypothetical protein
MADLKRVPEINIYQPYPEVQSKGRALRMEAEIKTKKLWLGLRSILE